MVINGAFIESSRRLVERSFEPTWKLGFEAVKRNFTPHDASCTEGRDDVPTPREFERPSRGERERERESRTIIGRARIVFVWCAGWPSIAP